MEESKGTLTKRLGIAATVVSLLGGSIALWDKFKPEDEVFDLNGKWNIALTVETSSTPKWVGHTWVFEVNVTPQEDGYVGKGEQVLFDALPPQGFNAFRLDPFHVKENRVVAGFTADISRVTNGMLDLRYDPERPDTLEGTFEWDAANKSGRVVAVRHPRRPTVARPL